MEKDPLNRLLHHYPVRRLEAEAVRDLILATSARLDRTLYGESIHPWRDTPKDYRRLFAGPLDGAGRRSIYLKVTRMEWARFLETFDFPAPLTARGARDSTNVPAQALALLNDPFVLDQAGFWAGRLLHENAANPAIRLTSMFERALGRTPRQSEIERWEALAFRLAGERGVPRGEVMSSHAVWKDVAHALFNLKEFVYVR